MHIVNKLTLRHLRLNRGRTLITVVGIMLSVAMVCAVAGFTASLRDVLRRDIVNYKGREWHIAYGVVAPEDVEKIAAEGGYFDFYYTVVTETQVDLYLHLAKPDRNYKKIAAAIAEKYGLPDYGLNNQLLALDGVIAEDNVLMTFIFIAAILIIVIVGGSIIVIANAFTISSSERVRQFGLLKSAGATKQQIRRSVLFEALILTAIAIPLGIAAGYLLQWTGILIVNHYLRDFVAYGILFRVVFVPFVPVISSVVAALTVLLSAWFPARRAAMIPAIEAIRMSREVRVRANEIKVSRFTQSFFGFEGTLAAKSLKRSRGKYRAAVTSLTLSVTLFILISSFVTMLTKASEMAYPNTDYDVRVYTSQDMEVQKALEEEIAAWQGAEYKTVRYVNLKTTAPETFFTSEFGKYQFREPGNTVYLSLIALPDRDFQSLAATRSNGIPGILLNTPVVTRSDSKLIEYRCFNYQSGLVFTFDQMYGDLTGLAEVTLVSEIQNQPDFLPSIALNSSGAILIPETMFIELIPTFTGGDGGQTVEVSFYVVVEDAEEFAQAMRDKFSVGAVNFQEQRKVNQSIVMVTSLFGYGFIAMLSLIAATSVVATISTGMALRRREFAMLRSAGMTAEGVNKMLNLESVLYGLKSLAFGLPVGTALSIAVWYILQATAVFNYRPPLAAVLISVAAVVLLSFVTMRHCKRKLYAVNIIETLRSELG